MIDRGAQSRYYLSGSGKTPIWEVFGRESRRDLSIEIGNVFCLSRIVKRFVSNHRWILSYEGATDPTNHATQLSHCYFVPAFIANIILHKLKVFSVLHDLDGIVLCGICKKTKHLVIDYEHHVTDHKVTHLRGFLCHSCNWHIMSVVDRLGRDKNYINSQGILDGEPSIAATRLLEYIRGDTRDQRVIVLQDEFDICTADLYGEEYRYLVVLTALLD